jgi:hypothetical protein
VPELDQWADARAPAGETARASINALELAQIIHRAYPRAKGTARWDELDAGVQRSLERSAERVLVEVGARDLSDPQRALIARIRSAGDRAVSEVEDSASTISSAIDEALGTIGLNLEGPRVEGWCDRLRDATRASFGANAESLLAPTFDGGSLTCVHSIDDREHALGFCGAIQEGWRRLREVSGDDFDYVFHLEEDWLFERPFNLAHLAALLDAEPRLAQVAFRRNAVAPAEKRAGGLVELWPQMYEEKRWSDGEVIVDYLEHSLYFTTNPSLYRRSLIDSTWPDGPRCEEIFGEALLAHGYRFALLGRHADRPWVRHTGTIRTGTGY